MELDRFSFIARFRAASQTEANRIWNVLFSCFCSSDVIGAQLYGCFQQTIDGYPISCYTAIISNLSYQISRKLYHRFCKCGAAEQDLLFSRAFPQHNEIRRVSDFLYLGTVSPIGSVSDGDVSYGCMHFSVTDTEFGSCRRKLFLCSESYLNFSVLSGLSTGTRIIPLKMDLSDSIMRFSFSLGAERTGADDGSVAYTLYDGTVIIFAHDKDSAAGLLDKSLSMGYDTFFINDPYVPDDSDIRTQLVIKSYRTLSDFLPDYRNALYALAGRSFHISANESVTNYLLSEGLDPSFIEERIKDGSFSDGYDLRL